MGPPPTEVVPRERPAPSREEQVLLVIASAPALARLALAAWWRSTAWATRTGVRAGNRVLRAAAEGESPAHLVEAMTSELRSYLRELLDAGEGGDAPARRAAAAPAEAEPVPSLRARGAELLRRSADIDDDDSAHPAYGHILADLAPDEARILRLFARQGPRAAVDVRTVGALGLGVGSELVAPGLTMIGAEAGCLHPARVPAYLNNLYRLGLVWFSREPLEDQAAYQVLEAQPDVTQALAGVRRGRTVRRSISLTPFGHEFCDVCLPVDTIEADALDPARPPSRSSVSGSVIAGDGTAEHVD